MIIRSLSVRSYCVSTMLRQDMVCRSGEQQFSSVTERGKPADAPDNAQGGAA
jgi:hypothetical protein